MVRSQAEKFLKPSSKAAGPPRRCQPAPCTSLQILGTSPKQGRNFSATSLPHPVLFGQGCLIPFGLSWQPSAKVYMYVPIQMNGAAELSAGPKPRRTIKSIDGGAESKSPLLRARAPTAEPSWSDRPHVGCSPAGFLLGKSHFSLETRWADLCCQLRAGLSLLLGHLPPCSALKG